MFSNVRYAYRSLLQTPGLSAIVILTLALGIGANTAIFSVVNAVLLKPLTYPDADRIVEFAHPAPDGSGFLADTLASIPLFRIYQHRSDVFQDVAAYDYTSPGFNITGDRPEQIKGMHVSEGYFRLFGAPVILGRTFTPQEDSPHGGKVVVLSHRLWQRKFGGERSIVGQSIWLGNESYTILGVIGPGFVSTFDADVWLPFQFEPASNNQNQYFQVAARLRPGITLARANAQMQLVGADFRQLYPAADPHAQIRFVVRPLRDVIVGDAQRSLWMILGAGAFLLLIACANIANLLLARAAGRNREFAIRAALGASRRRMIGQLLTESLLLSAAGGILGLTIGASGVRAFLAANLAGLPRIGEEGAVIAVDWRVLCFTLGVSTLTGILYGLLPALTASRADLNTSLKESNGRSGTGLRQRKTLSLLVVSEVSLALVLLVGAVLLIRSFVALHAVTPGFDSSNVLAADMSMTGKRLHTTAGIARLARSGREQLNNLPGVEASGFTSWLPNDVDDAMGFQIVGRPPGKDAFGARWMSFSPGYLGVFKIPILRGRDFNENDTAGNPGVVLINEALAKQCWPGEDPIGQHIIIGQGMSPDTDEPARTIIGIVGNTHNAGVGHPPDPMMMVPTAQVVDSYAAAYSDTSAQIWVVRTHGDPRQFTRAITEQLRIASGGLPIAHVRTMDEIMGSSTAREKFSTLLLTLVSATALFLAAIGIHGLMAYSVIQRTRELGIRMALGADRSNIRRLVIWGGMRLALVGVIFGVVLAFGLSRLMSSLLFGVTSLDALSFLVAPVVLCAVALFACWLPTRRAVRVDPLVALRAE